MNIGVDRAIELARTSYISECGLMRLDLEDRRRVTVGNYLVNTVKNENGILFLSVFYVLLDLLGLRPREAIIDDVSETIKKLEVKQGLYRRNVYPNDTRYEQHDNYVGIIALSMIFDFQYAVDIAVYGERSGYNYNNVVPGGWRFQQQRQPGEVAFYKLCAGFRPGPIEYVWLVAGLVINIFRLRRDASVDQLTWLRLFSLRKSFGRFPEFHGPMRLVLIGIMAIWRWRFKRKYVTVSTLMRSYYNDKDHPINRLSECLSENAVF
jgi:hypothetical protein